MSSSTGSGVAVSVRLLVFQSMTTDPLVHHQGAGAVSLVLLSAVVVLGVLRPSGSKSASCLDF